ncbi:MAG: energy-coupled thiamine transporter ThiT [Clostridia bacterium]|nr:energy-coupled thiamine transporter ThiT [Clostridia bacterium]
MLTNLFLFADINQDVALWISIGTAVVLVAILLVLSLNKKKMDTRSIAYAGISLALSFALSFVKFKVNANGGSITIGSMVPIMLYAYFFGPIKGLTVGLIHGLLQFIESPYVISPLSFFLDYPFAFAGVALVGLCGILIKNKPRLAIILGAVLAYLVRFIMHFASGFLFFTDLPFGEAFGANLVYQCTYIPLDMLIGVGILAIVVFTPAFKQLQRVAKPANAQNNA